MKILSLSARDVQPTRLVDIHDLSDVVVLAGPNGVGKTRLIAALAQYAQNPHVNPNFRVRVQATSEAETTQWQKDLLDTSDAADVQKLRVTLQLNRRRNKFTSNFLQFESNRTIQQLQPFQFSWESLDPFDEDVGWNMGFNPMTARFQDLLHSIFRKIRSRREAIASKAEQLIEERKRALVSGSSSSDRSYIEIDVNEFPDALEPFKDAFAQLLAPKELLDANPQNQQLRYSYEGAVFPITELSSGEREVVNIVFDFLLRAPTDSVVLFDEPELHLHPELSYRLLQTLRNTGRRNQFIFCTHSPEIITASLENTVVFIGPPSSPPKNQAIIVKEDDETNEALRLLGQSIGIISLGKRIVLIEGTAGSLDKQTYGAILKNRFPHLVLVPTGGKDVLRGFANLHEAVLGKTLWGVEFFMLCDRDAVSSRDVNEIESKARGRLKVLNRYHLENYFMDERVIVKIFEAQLPEGHWLRSETEVRARLKAIAEEHVSYAAALATAAHFRNLVGNVDMLPKGCHDKTVAELVNLFVETASQERLRINTALEPSDVEAYVREIMSELHDSLAQDSDLWRHSIPGKIITKHFCSGRHANIEYDRFKLAYINATEVSGTDTFTDIISIFEQFNA